ncbi:MAG: nitrate reductase [Pseudomonadota bacterium]
MDAGPAKTIRTTCPYCGVGCGIQATQSAAGVTVNGDKAHPANFGRLCSKGTQLAETIGLEDRLLYPEIAGTRSSWTDAINTVADAFTNAIAEHGPESVAFYVSGQLLTEDYYVTNKLMKGFIGSANIDTNSRLCMASSVAGHKRAFGADTVPGTYEDLELADLVVLTGSNLAWCHPVLYQRIAAAKKERAGGSNPMRVVVIDPRRTATCAIADLHLPLAPDTDVALFTGLLRHLARVSVAHEHYVDAHTVGIDEALSDAQSWTIERVSETCRLRPSEVARFYDWVTSTTKTVTVYSQGVNQSTSGTDKVGSIINTHLLTGRIGKPGMGPFSVTGQPNAMGGREVGGLANMLAAHMELANPDHRQTVQAFWGSPTIADKPGLKAVDLFEAIHDGRIKALWVMATNPAVSLPDADRVDDALAKVPFLAVSDVVSSTDTLRHTRRPGGVALPASAWAEKDGTVTNSERVISRQKGFLPLPGEARHDWRIICDVADAMGFGHGFDFASPHEVFDEHARLSGAGKPLTRDFDISGLAGLSKAAYDALNPVRWPLRADGARTERFFAQGGFYHPDGKARFIVPKHTTAQKHEPKYPFTLNTGRVRDHWHTMTRTGRSPRLSGHMAEPYCELHTHDAKRLGITPASLVRLSSPHGSAVLRALVTDDQQVGSVFAPMHWNAQTSNGGRIDALVAPETDPFSGQPALKFSRVRVKPAGMAWHGFAVLAERPSTLPFAYWSIATCEGGFALEFADTEPSESLAAIASELIGGKPDLGYEDRVAGSARFVSHQGRKLSAAVFIAREPVAVSRRWAIGMLTEPLGDARSRLALLAGRPAASQADHGPIVCSCFSVGRNTINTAIAGGASTVEEVGTRCKAGTNCGSCRSEISGLLERAGTAPPALLESAE